jgi:hypothetical protein
MQEGKSVKSSNLKKVLDALDFSKRFCNRILESKAGPFSCFNSKSQKAVLADLDSSSAYDLSNSQTELVTTETDMSGIKRDGGRKTKNMAVVSRNSTPSCPTAASEEISELTCKRQRTKRRGRPKGVSSDSNGAEVENDMDAQSKRSCSRDIDINGVVLKRSSQHIEGVAMMPSYLRSRFGDR